MTEKEATVSILENEFLNVYKGMMELIQLTIEGDSSGKLNDLLKMIKDSDTSIDSVLNSLSEDIPKNVAVNSLIESIKNKADFIELYRTKLEGLNQSLLESKIKNFQKICKITDDFLSL